MSLFKNLLVRRRPKRVLDRLYWRAQDQALLRDPLLLESLRQMRAGEYGEYVQDHSYPPVSEDKNDQESPRS